MFFFLFLLTFYRETLVFFCFFFYKNISTTAFTGILDIKFGCFLFILHDFIATVILLLDQSSYILISFQERCKTDWCRHYYPINNAIGEASFLVIKCYQTPSIEHRGVVITTWRYRTAEKRALGPVVQSIISLTSSFRSQLVKCFTTL